MGLEDLTFEELVAKYKYEQKIAYDLVISNDFGQRQLIQETDYRSLALTEAGKLNNRTPQELLSNADKIYQWLRERETKLWKRNYPLTPDEAVKIPKGYK